MKKNVWIAIIAGAAAVVAGAVAVAAYVRKKSRALAEHLDYDPDEYFEEECSCDDEDCCCHECGCAEEAEAEEEETIPLYPDETAADESEAMPDESEQE